MTTRSHRLLFLIAACLPFLSLSALPTSEPLPPRDPASARKHWAYQPVRKPPVPKVRNQRLVQTPVDAFVLAKLEARGLSFAPAADRRTLIRRASYDLIGLPPEVEAIDSFLQDRSPDAFARVVDRLLASPHYGERWGRHWLDVARYADTKDLVLLFGKDRLRPYAYTYRDYVIRALNLDTPFDQFVREQIAADRLDPKVEPWRLAALGFLTLGRLYDNNPHDQIDDQIDTVTRGFLGLTVACARCHDHKYDAISMEDYYGLYGVFANSEQPYDLPLIEPPLQVAGGAEFELKLAEARQKLQDHIDAEYEKLSETARQRVTDYLVRVATTEPDLAETATFFLSLTPEELRPGLVNRWRRFIEQRARPDDPIFGLWARLMHGPEETLAERLQAALASAPAGLNPLVRQAFSGASLANKADVARFYGDLFQRVYERAKRTPVAASGAELSAADRELLDVLLGKDGPVYFPKRDTPHHMSRPEKDQFNSLVLALDKLAAYATNRPPARAMVVADAPELAEPRVFVRGSPARPGERVPRAFLRVLSDGPRRPFIHGSGRLELAQAITAPNNPLTARVLVNRVWMHHFGEPLVGSPGDFGTRSDPPTHPELLDYLAWTFMEQGWSLKKLHRLILRSAVYQQTSLAAPAGGSVGKASVRSAMPSASLPAASSPLADATLQPVDTRPGSAALQISPAMKVDPDNRLLWRFHRRRLEFEAMRDTLLFVSGRLDPALGGRPEDVAADPLNRRRTVYGLVDRQDLPAVFRAFDFAVPDQCVDRRPRTSTPQQALFAMNAPFVLEQVKALVARPEILRESDPGRRVAALYRRVLGRLPAADEVAGAVRFIREAEAGVGSSAEDRLSAWEQFAQALLMSNEATFVD